MGSVQLVVDPPILDDLAGMPVAAEQVLVEALVPQPALKLSIKPSCMGCPLNDCQQSSEVFCQHLAERRYIHHLLRQRLLQLRILFLDRLQPLGVRYLHAVVLLAPGVERRISPPRLGTDG